MSRPPAAIITGIHTWSDDVRISPVGSAICGIVLPVIYVLHNVANKWRLLSESSSVSNRRSVGLFVCCLIVLLYAEEYSSAPAGLSFPCCSQGRATCVRKYFVHIMAHAELGQ